jgi:tetratricopeptide (TPR) repeat protein
MRTVHVAVAVALAAAVSGAPAAAEPVPAKARKLAERGRELHERGDYARAIVAFKEAYVLAPSPGLLFNLAQAYRLQGNCDDAVLMYRRFIASVPAWRDERTLAEGHLATVMRCVQKRNLNLPPDPAMAHLPVPPPPGPDPLFEDEPSPDRSRGTLMRRVGLGATVGSAVALGAAAYFSVRALRASSEVERLYAEGASWPQIEPTHARGERAERNALWLGLGGGLGAAAGVSLYVLGRRTERTPPVTVTPSRGGARIGLAWAF